MRKIKNNALLLSLLLFVYFILSNSKTMNLFDNFMLLENRHPAYFAFFSELGEARKEDKPLELKLPRIVINSLSYSDIMLLKNNANFIYDKNNGIRIDFGDESGLYIHKNNMYFLRENKINVIDYREPFSSAWDRIKNGYLRNECKKELCNVTDIYEYLELIKNVNYTIIVSGKDETSSGLTKGIRYEMSKLGMKKNLLHQFRKRYVFIGRDGNVGCEVLSEKDIKKSGVFEKINYFIESSSDKSSIVIEGMEYSVNSRGLNFVVYDNSLDKVIDAVSFDTYDGLLASRESFK